MHPHDLRRSAVNTVSHSTRDNKDNSPEEVNILPYIKDELRCFIHCKRHSQHKEDFKPDLSPRTPDVPSIEDLEMQKDRRERNNSAARKYRNKLKRVQTRIIKDYSMQVRENKNLRKTIDELFTERSSLISILKAHAAMCNNAPLREKSEKLAAYFEGCGPAVPVTCQLSSAEVMVAEKWTAHDNQIDECELEPEILNQCESFYDNSWNMCEAKRHMSESDLRAEAVQGFTSTPTLEIMAYEISAMAIPTIVQATSPHPTGFIPQSPPRLSYMTQSSPAIESPQSAASHWASYQFPPSTSAPDMNYTSAITAGPSRGIQDVTVYSPQVLTPALTLVTSIDSPVTLSSTEIPSVTMASRHRDQADHEQYCSTHTAQYTVL